jgi:hypothetical protein
MICEICWGSGGEHNPRCPNAIERAEYVGPDLQDYLDDMAEAERLDEILGQE